MPRRRNRIPSYTLHRASGQAVVRLDGRDHYLGRFDSPESHARYEALVAEWLTRRQSEQLEAMPVADDELTINELLAAYLRFAERYYVKDGKPTKEVSNLKYAVKPMAAIYGTTAVKDFGPLRLKTVREAMVQADLARSVINERVNRIRRVFRWGVENQLVRSEVLRALEAVSPLKRGRCEARETEPVKPVPDEHITAVIRAAPLTLAVMIEIQWLTGMRPGEVVLMRPCDIDRTGDVWFYRPQRHKTEHFGVEREVPLGPKARTLLAKLSPVADDQYYFSPKAAMQERYAARPTHRRKPNTTRKTARSLQERYTTQSYGRAVVYLCEKVGVPLWSPNQLRHAAATRLRREHGLDVAQAVLGHKTARITQVYAALDRSKAADVIQKVG